MIRRESGGGIPHDHQIFPEHAQSPKMKTEKARRIVHICCLSSNKISRGISRISIDRTSSQVILFRAFVYGNQCWYYTGMTKKGI